MRDGLAARFGQGTTFWLLVEEQVPRQGPATGSWGARHTTRRLLLCLCLSLCLCGGSGQRINDWPSEPPGDAKGTAGRRSDEKARRPNRRETAERGVS